MRKKIVRQVKYIKSKKSKKKDDGREKNERTSKQTSEQAMDEKQKGSIKCCNSSRK